MHSSHLFLSIALMDPISHSAFSRHNECRLFREQQYALLFVLIWFSLWVNRGPFIVGILMLNWKLWNLLKAPANGHFLFIVLQYNLSSWSEFCEVLPSKISPPYHILHELIVVSLSIPQDFFCILPCFFFIFTGIQLSVLPLHCRLKFWNGKLLLLCDCSMTFWFCMMVLMKKDG